jgi:hypothetical protein
MISKRELLRGNATERKETSQVSVAEQLKMLAAEFAKWQIKPPKETIDLEMVEVLDVKDKGDQESQMVEDTEHAIEVLDSDEQGGLGAPDEGEPSDGTVDGESWTVR